MEATEILNWSHLGTTAAVSAAVVILTQAIKHFVPEKLDPKWVALPQATRYRPPLPRG